MSKKNVGLLKLILSTMVMLCLTLSVFVTQNFVKSESVFNSLIKYNTVPYIDNATEIAYADTSNVYAIDTFIGTITAYGPDCVGCSGITASGYKVAKNINGTITSITTTYNDREFGTVNVLAAANNKFPFGTILRISGDRIDNSITGIVLDTGIAMRNAWAKGDILIDLLFDTEKNQAVYDFGRQKNVKFEVLRYGY